jgi:hypothetical protein
MRQILRSRCACAIVAAAACSAALAALAGAAPSRDRVLRFTTVERDSIPERAPVSTTYAFASVADRITHDPRDQPGPAIDYRKFATVYVAIVRSTSGYSVTIKRLTLQRHGTVDQICARVAIAAPPADRIVTQVKTRFWHFVKIPRKSFGASVPTTIVARATTGRLLYTLASARAGLCK